MWEGNSYYDPLVYLVYDNDRYYPLFDPSTALRAGYGSTRQLTDEDEDVTDTYSIQM